MTGHPLPPWADSWRSRLRSSFLLPIALVLLAIVAVVPPIGDFPLNDDWVYARMVRELVENHAFFAHPYRSALAVTSTGWGALAALGFGESHTVLRCSTLLLALVAVWATTRGAFECGLSRPMAFLCGALSLANPIFLNLSYTFMTDVPFLAASGLSGLFYLRALKRRRAADAFWGSVSLAVASATRQVGVVLIAPILLTEVVSWMRGAGKPKTQLVLAFAAPLVLGAGLYWGAFGLPWGEAVRLQPEGTGRPTVLQSIPQVLRHVAAALTYMGLFTLPIALGKLAALVTRADRRSPRQWAAFALVCLLLLLGSTTVVNGQLTIGRMPLLPNVLYDLGAGPFTLRDVFLIADNAPVSLGGGWWAVQILSLTSAALLIVDVGSRLLLPLFDQGTRERGPAEAADRCDARWLFLATWVGSIALLPYDLVTQTMFDRYLLPTLFPVTILAAASVSRAARRRVLGTAWMSALALFVFSLICVQDYLAWNTARWTAIHYLRTERGIAAQEIDGGYEYNGIHLSEEFRRRYGATQFWEMGAGWFWVLEESRYSVFGSDIPGCRLEQSFPYFSWLGFETRRLFAVHCENSPV